MRSSGLALDADSFCLKEGLRSGPKTQLIIAADKKYAFANLANAASVSDWNFVEKTVYAIEVVEGSMRVADGCSY